MPKRPLPLLRTVAELRRRHVFRVVAAYAICAWIILQVADVVFPPLMVPGWVHTVLVLLAIAGLPAVAFLTWVYDISPEGVVRTGSIPQEEREALRWNWRWIDYAIIVALVGILVFVLVRDGPGEFEPDHSIAVLPFTDLSPEGDNRYFSDGMSEALIDSLVRIPELHVASRTSSFSFRDSDKSMRDVAEALGVGTVLEGSVRKAGNRIRISARLVDGRRGNHLWNDTFEGTLDDVFRVQDDISRAIVDVLKVRLLGDRKLVDVPTRNQDAYDAYLRGRDRLRSEGTLENFERALAYFEQAIELDQEFGLAHAGLCTAYWEQYGISRDPELANRAIDACKLAQQYDEGRAETLVALGNLYLGTGQHEQAHAILARAIDSEPNNADANAGFAESLRVRGDLAGAEQYYRRAIELDPAYWRHYFYLGRVLQEQGRIEETISNLRRASQLQPGNPLPYFSLGAIYFYQGEYLLAAETTQKSIELSPSARAYSNAGSFYFYAGEYAKAEAMFRQSLALSPGDFRWHGFLAEAIDMQADPDRRESRQHFENAIRLGYERLEVNPAAHADRALVAGYLAVTGKTGDARAELELLETAGDLDMHAHRGMAMAYLALGEHGAAIRHFKAALEKGYSIQILESDPRLEPLFNYPEFVALFRDTSGVAENNTEGEHR